MTLLVREGVIQMHTLKSGNNTKIIIPRVSKEKELRDQGEDNTLK